MNPSENRLWGILRRDVGIWAVRGKYELRWKFSVPLISNLSCTYQASQSVSLTESMTNMVPYISCIWIQEITTRNTFGTTYAPGAHHRRLAELIFPSAAPALVLPKFGHGRLRSGFDGFSKCGKPDWADWFLTAQTISDRSQNGIQRLEAFYGCIIERIHAKSSVCVE